jgi:hypothetical protein
MDNLVSVYTTVYTKHLVYSVPSYNSGMPNGQSVISVLPTGADLWLFQSFRFVAKPLVLEGLKFEVKKPKAVACAFDTIRLGCILWGALNMMYPLACNLKRSLSFDRRGVQMIRHNI